MKGKRVVLAEWHWIGHHPTFFAYFVLALEELGVDVLALCPHPEETKQTVARLRTEHGTASGNERTIYRQITKTRRRLNQGRLARLGSIDWSLRHFRAVEKMAGEWQSESGQPVDLIFYACIHESDFDSFHLAAPFLRLPWAGLYLHALSIRMPGQKIHTGRLPRPEKIFRGNLCRAVATFDEGITSQLETVTQKPVVVFPDLTDDRLPSDSSGRMLEHRLRSFAGARPLVGLFGYLMKSKGVHPLALISRHPKMSEIGFAFVGEMAWNTFSPSEAETICDVLSNRPNTWNHLMRIPGEERLNSLLSACDILYAAYLNFSSSSNILAKAALFQKPLIVSYGHLMAERVRRFRMGEVVPQGDVEAQVEALDRIIRNPQAWVEKNQPLWQDYAREHSFSRLKQSFSEVLSKL